MIQDLVGGLSLDPEMIIFTDISPYVGFVNNPIIVVDENGDTNRIVVSNEFKKRTLAALQKLTNDELSMLVDGTVIIKKLGGQNPGKNLKYGTSLIRELNKKGQPDAKLVTIIETKGGNYTSGHTKNANLKPDGTPNSGENAVVGWNPYKTEGGVNIEGKTERPTEIGLGHELIHARHLNKGIRDPESSGRLDPDGSGVILSNEELNTRKEENMLRREQGVTLRKIP